MTTPTSGSCPNCRSGNIRNRYATRWECRRCNHRFDAPLALITVEQAQALIDTRGAESPYWRTAEGQVTLAVASQWHLVPHRARPGEWGIIYAIRGRVALVDGLLN